MPGKYQIEAVFELRSELEPEGYLAGIEDAEGVTDYEDTSSWDTAGFTCDGGVVNFVVEADSEDNARELAQSALDSAYFSESSNISWEVEDYSISSIECIEEPMDMERAKRILVVLIGRLEMLTVEEREAISFILDTLTP